MILSAIKLNKGQYISNIEPFKSIGIPPNSIVHKKVPGCGITTFEMRFAKHHSIIILPNVPVIKSKVNEHNTDYPEKEILGVYKGVDVDDIADYLAKDIEYKKILTTPEGFMKKVVNAFDQSAYDMKKQFFLLYDECERIVTDVDYRGDIAAPLDLFHEFDNKAMVSATPLPFSDEKLQYFNHFHIEPQYDYSKPLTVINTNNVLTSTNSFLEKLNSKHVFIFLNSSNGISAVIDHNGIANTSKIYCGEESVRNLRLKGKVAFDDCKLTDLKQYTFLTSRYFSAFDIKLDYKPDVILISDILFANYSILDPFTDVIQIAGRFRNGINSLTHITSFNKFMEVKTEDEAKTYLEGCLDTYEQVVDLFKKAKHKGSAETLKFFVDHSPIAPFFINGKRNAFMIDNGLNQERVKNYYTGANQLQEAYSQLKDHFNLSVETDKFNVGDDDFFNLKKAESKRERNEQVARLLDRYTSTMDKFVLMTERTMQQRSWLVKKFPVIAEAVTLLGLTKLLTVGFDSKDLKGAIKNVKKANQILKVADIVHDSFAPHTIIDEQALLTSLEDIYKANTITLKVSAKHILRYFKGKRSQRQSKNVYVLDDKIHKSLIQETYKL